MAKRFYLPLFVLSLIVLIAGCEQAEAPTAVEQPEQSEQIEATEVPTEEPVTPEPAGVWVDPSNSLGEINPLVYGTNYGPWQAITLENMPNLDESGLKFIRFPGGRWGDTHNLRDYQIRQLMAHVDQIEGDVTISARLLGGTPEQAADLLKMVNEEMGHDVRLWSIGNEPSLYRTMQQAEEWDTVYFNEQWRQFAEAMLAVDPDITILGPNTHQFRQDETQNPKDANGLDWMREFLKANGDMVDVVTFHRYPFPTSLSDPSPDRDALRNSSEEWDEIIPKIREVIREETGKDLPIGIMEINSNWTDASGSETTADSHLNAIWWADVLARLIKQDVDMVTHFALQNNSAGWAMMNRTGVRPTYYTFQMYDHLGESKVAAGSDERYVTVLAAERASDSALTVLLINRSDDPITVPFEIAGEKEISVSERWVFDTELNAENQGSQTLNGSIDLPGLSMTLLVVE